MTAPVFAPRASYAKAEWPRPGTDPQACAEIVVAVGDDVRMRSVPVMPGYMVRCGGLRGRRRWAELVTGPTNANDLIGADKLVCTRSSLRSDHPFVIHNQLDHLAVDPPAALNCSLYKLNRVLYGMP
jgi:hypothetical protein